MLVPATGATVFVIVPYIANLMVAANMKKLVRKNDDAAKAYFQYYACKYLYYL